MLRDGDVGIERQMRPMRLGRAAGQQGDRARAEVRLGFGRGQLGKFGHASTGY